MEEEFPFRVSRAVAAAAGDGPVCVGGGFAFCAEADRVNVFRTGAETGPRVGGDEVAAILGAKQERVAKNRFDSEGFASIVYDEITKISCATLNDVLHVAVLHRSGLVQSWRYDGHFEAMADDEETGEQQEPELETKRPTEQWKFTPLASWVFVCPTGAPRFLQCHQTLPVVVVTSSTGRTKVYDVVTGSLTHHFEHMLLGGDLATSMVCHPRRGLILIGSEMGQLIVCDLWRKCIVSSTPAHSSSVIDTVFVDIALGAGSEKIPCFVSIAHSNEAKLWSLLKITEEANVRLSKRLRGSGTRPLLSDQIRADLGLKPVSREDNELCIEKQMATLMAKMDLSEECVAVAVLLTPQISKALVKDSKKLPPWLILLAGESGALHLYDLINGKKLAYRGETVSNLYTFVVPRPPIRSFVKTAEHLITVTTTGGLVWWPLGQESFEPVTCFKGQGAVSSASVICSTTDSSDMTVYSCTVRGDIFRESVRWAEGGVSVVHSMSVNDDGVIGSIDRSHCGTHLAFTTKLGRLVVVKVAANECILEVPSGTVGPLLHVAFSAKPLNFKATTLPGRPFVASVGTDNFVRIWPLLATHTVSKSSEAMWKASDKPVYCIAVSGDNTRIATAGADKQVKVWDTATGESLATLKGHKAAVTALAFHPSEPLLASASVDGTVRIWQSKTWECVETLSGLSSSCTVLRYVSEGKKLVGGCVDGALHTWYAVVGKSKHLGSSIAHDDQINAVSEIFFAGRISIVSAGCDGSVKLWLDQSRQIEEAMIQQERQEKQDLVQVDMWLRDGEFGQAIKAACRWRKVEPFKKIVDAVIKAKGEEAQKFDLATLVRAEFTTVEDVETLLLAAILFCKRRHTLYIAHWIASAILASVDVTVLRRVDGFREFCTAFTAKSVSQVNRWERLNEKSFLLNLMAHSGNLVASAGSLTSAD